MRALNVTLGNIFVLIVVSNISFLPQEIEIKNQSGQSLSYAFIQFDNIRSVVTALREMDGEHVSGSKIKVSNRGVVHLN